MAMRIIIILCLFLAMNSPVFGLDVPKLPGEKAGAKSKPEKKEDPFRTLVENALSFFTPVTATITEVEENSVLIAIGEESGIRTGMRLDILRTGASFLHPITKEPIGQTEEQVGRAEVVDICPDSATLNIISGTALPGDIVRISSAKVRGIFYQTSDVDWNLSEEYYYRLKETARFELIDTAPGMGTDEEIVNEARVLNADVAIVLSSVGSPLQTELRQRLLWVEDVKELSSVNVVLAEDVVRKYKLGEEFFTPEKNQPTITFTIPYSTRLISAGDINGDGEIELALSTGNTLRFYSFGASLRPALDAAELKGKITDDHIWMDIEDIDEDGRDEILLTSIYKTKITSSLYQYKGGAFSELWTDNIYARIIDGKLFGQKRSIRGGYNGSVFHIAWKDETTTYKDQDYSLNLPENINIYDFSFVLTSYGTRVVLGFDYKGYLNMHDEANSLIWRSNDKYGGATKVIDKEDPWGVKTFEHEDNRTAVDAGKWYVSDRIINLGDSAYTVKRLPLAGKVSGIAFRKSQIMGLLWNDTSVQEAVRVDDIPGSVIDYAISGRKLFVLTSSLGINPANILKGKSLFTSRLYIYSLNGR
jgi:hypothetical protein